MTRTEQRKQAMDWGNHIRTYRADLKRNLYSLRPAGKSVSQCAEIIYNPLAPELKSMSVGDLIGACYRTGPAWTLLTLRKSGVREGLKLGDLSERQRAALCSALMDRADRLPVAA